LITATTIIVISFAVNGGVPAATSPATPAVLTPRLPITSTT
jgi:hypothetical protein